MMARFTSVVIQTLVTTSCQLGSVGLGGGVKDVLPSDADCGDAGRC
jgi:hypothetical protein